MNQPDDSLSYRWSYAAITDTATEKNSSSVFHNHCWFKGFDQAESNQSGSAHRCGRALVAWPLTPESQWFIPHSATSYWCVHQDQQRDGRTDKRTRIFLWHILAVISGSGASCAMIKTEPPASDVGLKAPGAAEHEHKPCWDGPAGWREPLY